MPTCGIIGLPSAILIGEYQRIPENTEGRMENVPYAEAMPVKGTHVDLPVLVMSAMHWVELQSVHMDVHGKEKFDLFRSNVGKILDYAAANGFVDVAQHAKLQGYLNESFDLVEGLVTMYAAIAKNPTVIQMEEEVKAGCSALCKKRK